MFEYASKSVMKCRFAAVALLVIALGGCQTQQSFDSSQSRTSMSTSPATRSNEYSRTVTPSTTTQSSSQTPRIALNDDQYSSSSSIAFSTAEPTRRDFGANAALIGLYGELTGNAPGTNPVSDGARNIVQVTTASEGAVFDPTVAPNGSLMAFASTIHSTTSDIYLQSTTGSTITQLTDDPGDDVMPTFSPDGNYLAFASNRAGNWNIYYVPTAGGRPVQLTFETEHELHPSWSPDGKMIAYSRYGMQSGKWEVWTVDIENPSVRRLLVYGMFPEWNPDVTKSKLLFQRPRQRGSRYHSVWTIDYINGESMHPTEIVSAANAAAINPSWSPDGNRIVFVTVIDPEAEPSAKPGQCDLWVVDLDGANRTNLTNGKSANYQPTWATDGNIYFVSNRSGVDNIWSVVGENGGTPREVNSATVGVDSNKQHPGGQR